MQYVPKLGISDSDEIAPLLCPINFSTVVPALDDDIPIWRYMPERRLKALIDTGQLWVASLTKMKDLEEGRAPPGQRRLQEKSYPPDVSKALSCITDAGRGWFFVSSWSEGTNESAQHWREFADEGRGVAIRSSVGRLRKAINNKLLVVARIQYHSSDSEDYLTDGTGGDLIGNALWKQQELFGWENEIRLIGYVQPPEPNFPSAEDNADNPAGFGINTDIRQLALEVRLGQAMPNSDRAANRAFIQTQLNGSVPVLDSQMSHCVLDDAIKRSEPKAMK